MTPPRQSLAAELAEIRAEIARLKQRETALASIEHAFPVVPVFRRTWTARPVDRAITAHA
ncbi:MAG: hypothetical protein NTW20_11345 [Rhodobacterales bacterium]|nr:hypothetical protein [Rhodobacterales bacterium]